MERHFDLIYHALSLLIGLALVYAALTGLIAARRSADLRTRRQASGIAIAAVGVAIALVGGLFADAVLKRSASFQQVRFGLYYLGFALITLGTARIAVRARATSRTTIPALFVWACFIGPLAVAVVYLADPRTFMLNAAGLQVQRTIYWIPLLAASGSPAVMLAIEALRRDDQHNTDVLWWAAAFAVLICFGLLREALILPDLGDPLRNLLIAFVPFALGSVCLALSARTTLNPTSPSQAPGHPLGQEKGRG